MGWLSRLIRDDRIFLGYLIITAAGWLWGARMLLKRLRDDAEIKPVQPKTQYITQETEDALKLSTLDTLLGHYNHSIRDTAAKIVCDRAINDNDTVDLLLWGMTREDYDERMKNLRALAIITDAQGLERLHRWKAYAALVRCLELSLDPDQEVLDDEDWDEYALRDMTEKLCLMFISQLINCYDAEKLIKARFVEKWLAKQNWGATDEERQRNFARYLNRRSNRITDIVASIRGARSGREALEKARLLPPSASKDSESDDDVPMMDRFSVLFPSVNVDNIREDDPAALLIRTLRAAQSAEEQRVRHRHREAMVLNDGSHPVNSSDIIQRDPESPS